MPTQRIPGHDVPLKTVQPSTQTDNSTILHNVLERVKQEIPDYQQNSFLIC